MSSKKPISLREVFVPGGLPKYTYQKRNYVDQQGDTVDIELELIKTLRRVNKFIAVAGPTKSGKTVLVRSCLNQGIDNLWIEGGHFDKIEEIWEAVLEDLGHPSSYTETVTHQDESSGFVDTTGGIRPGGIGAEVKVQKATKSVKNEGRSETYKKTGAKAAIEALVAARKVLVIDDFHYLPEAVQTKLIRALKPAVFNGLQVVLLLIPHRMHQAAQAEIDVDGRTATIKIPDWQDKELFSIAESGFNILKATCAPSIIDQLVKEALASPHLMQDFCSKLCEENEVYGEQINPKEIILKPPFNRFFERLASGIAPDAFEALRKGPERTNRIERDLLNGGKCDTYEAIMLALKETGAETPINWTNLRKALQSILSDVPQQHEITRALEKMDEIAKMASGEPIIDYMKKQGDLHLVDPFFRFYLKWNNSLAEQTKAKGTAQKS
jgi:hypothetical protein